MKGALVILAVLIVVGVVLYLFDRRRGERSGEEREVESGERRAGECCGMHAVCEKKYASLRDDARPVYYDDYELDVLSGRAPESYTEQELAMLREVLTTLRSEDAYGWSLSLEMRDIRLPDAIRDELLLLMQG